eukprot:CAMPEP_0171589890 /NCGR_PEP_ID=MMETSP0961-20121227/15166_1 /TAXON_ID=87120 /ORGANISM="Aurantiochytrium limacinum, Strain ATCCMYA-1381" /LENGTH=68 /DNA_ID=CAMNT_0012149371 /DNA_START=597 /DNA_END=803 /DNA_ORIENTATION=-
MLKIRKGLLISGDGVTIERPSLAERGGRRLGPSNGAMNFECPTAAHEKKKRTLAPHGRAQDLGGWHNP